MKQKSFEAVFNFVEFRQVLLLPEKPIKIIFVYPQRDVVLREPDDNPGPYIIEAVEKSNVSNKSEQSRKKRQTPNEENLYGTLPAKRWKLCLANNKTANIQNCSASPNVNVVEQGKPGYDSSRKSSSIVERIKTAYIQGMPVSVQKATTQDAEERTLPEPQIETKVQLNAVCEEQYEKTASGVNSKPSGGAVAAVAPSGGAVAAVALQQKSVFGKKVGNKYIAIVETANPRVLVSKLQCPKTNKSTLQRQQNKMAPLESSNRNNSVITSQQTRYINKSLYDMLQSNNRNSDLEGNIVTICDKQSELNKQSSGKIYQKSDCMEEELVKSSESALCNRSPHCSDLDITIKNAYSLLGNTDDWSDSQLSDADDEPRNTGSPEEQCLKQKEMSTQEKTNEIQHRPQKDARLRLTDCDRCAYCYTYKSSAPGRKFFRFPRDAVRSKKWVLACERPYLFSKSVQQLYRSYRLCSEHFVPADYSSTKMHRLKSTAYPKFHSGPRVNDKDNTIRSMRHAIYQKMSTSKKNSLNSFDVRGKSVQNLKS